MSHRHSSVGRIAFLACIAATSIGSARAATINVPADQPTIQQAIDNAMPGDTILIADGSYAEELTIDVEDLTIISVNGAASVRIIAGLANAAVTILADGVHFGAPGQGVTLDPKDVNTGILIEGSVVGPGSVVIEDNVILGNSDSYGIAVNPTIIEGHLVIRNNTLSRTSPFAGFSFRTGIKFRSEFFNELDASACAYKANIEIIGNTIEDVSEYGIRFKDWVYFSDVTIQGGSISGAEPPIQERGGICEAPIGVYFDEITTHSHALVDALNIAGVSEGVRIDGGVYDQSSLGISDCTIDYCYAGINADESAVDHSLLLIDGNTIRGATDPIGPTWGVYFSAGPAESSAAVINNNTIHGHVDSGVYTSNPIAVNLSELVVTDNDVRGHETWGSNYGLYFNGALYGAELHVSSNEVTQFRDVGIIVYETYGGGHYRVLNNIVTGFEVPPAEEPDMVLPGALYGIYGGAVGEGGRGEISDNTISGIGFPILAAGRSECPIGIAMEFVGEGAEHVICRNSISGNGYACYGIYFDETPTDGADQTICENEIRGFRGGPATGIYFGGSCQGLTRGIPCASGFGSRINIMKNSIEDSIEGILFASHLYSALTIDVIGNVIHFEDMAVRFFEVTGCQVTIEQNRFISRFSEVDELRGINFAAVWFDTLNGGSEARVSRNCFDDVRTGIFVLEIFDVAFLEAHRNDFAGAVIGIDAGIGVLPAHRINGEDNWWGDPAGPNAAGSQTNGEVNADPFLTAPPDADGDGVADCDDECPDTPPGAEVDDWGCSEPPPEDPEQQEQPMDDFMTDFQTNAGHGIPGCGQCGPIGSSLYSLSLFGYVAALFARRRRR